MKRDRRHIDDDDDDDDDDEDIVNEDEKHSSKENPKTQSFIEDEAEEDEDDGYVAQSPVDDDEDDDEDDEEEAQNLRDAMIAEDDDVDAEIEAANQQRRRKKADATSELVDDDYDLLRENLGYRVGPKKRSRDESSSPRKRLLRRQDSDDNVERAHASAYDIEDLSASDEDDDGGGFIVDDIGGEEGRMMASDRGFSKDGDAGEIFGDMSEFLARSREASEDEDEVDITETQSSSVKRVKRQLDPTVAVKHHRTENDAIIRSTDIPERMQSRVRERVWNNDEESRKTSLIEEATWIFHTHFMHIDQAVALQSIIHILREIRQENMEVSYIAQYQRDYYTPLTESDVWIIDECDMKWDQLTAKRTAFTNYLRRVGVNDTELDIITSSAHDHDDLDDIRVCLRQSDRYANSFGFNRRSTSRAVNSSDIESLVQQLFIPARKFGLNLRSVFDRHSATNPTLNPQETAQTFVGEKYKSVDDVLQSARSTVARNLATDPIVRSEIRKRYADVVTISTSPSQSGLSTIDWLHPYFAVKRLKNKPAVLFNKYDFILLQKAEYEGFITTSFEVPGLDDDGNDQIMRDIQPLFLSDAYSSNSQAWNQQRSLALQQAFRTHLYKMAEKCVRKRLMSQASTHVLRSAASSLKELIRFKSPCRPHNAIIACVVGERQEPSYIAAVDANGVMIDHIQLYNMRVFRRQQSSGSVQIDHKAEDIRKFKKFVEKYHATFIAVSASSMSCRKFIEEARKATISIEGFDVDVEFVDPCVALIASNSSRMTDEMPHADSLLKYAVALARFIRDPLTELCNLASNPADLCSLSLHSLQSSVSRSHLIATLHRVLITQTNQVGVDINLIAEHQHLSGPLRFVCGLGSRKAKHIIDHLQRNGCLFSRQDLLDQKVIGSIVYRNCAAFLRIIAPSHASDTKVSALENTRMHPEIYVLSDRVVVNALDLKTGDSRFSLIDKLRLPSNIGKLEELDLYEYAKVMERNGDGKHSKSLMLVKQELKSPFKDSRLPFASYSDERLFALLTGETPEVTISRGQMIDVTVSKTDHWGINVKLDSGLFGKVSIMDISDEMSQLRAELSVEDLLSRLHGDFPVGLALQCLVKDFNFRHFRVDLVLDLNRYSYIREDIMRHRFPDTFTLVLPTDDEHLSGSIAQDKTKLPKFARRNIDHPLFANVDNEAAESSLADKPVGEVVIRPSSRGMHFLTLTWKAADDVYVHIQIAEFEKPNDVKSALGKVLEVEAEKYDDLDEILERYVRPMTTRSTKMTAHTKFRLGTEEEVDELLHDEKKDNPNKIPYFFCANSQNIGMYVLAYLPNERPRHEIIRVKPNGYRFRKLEFPTLSNLVSWFKKHWSDRPKSSRVSRKSASRHATQSRRSPPSSHHQQRQQQQQQPQRHHPSSSSSTSPSTIQKNHGDNQRHPHHHRHHHHHQPQRQHRDADADTRPHQRKHSHQPHRTQHHLQHDEHLQQRKHQPRRELSSRRPTTQSNAARSLQPMLMAHTPSKESKTPSHSDYRASSPRRHVTRR